MSVNDASRIVIQDFRMMLQIVASLTADSGGIIYDCNMFYNTVHCGLYYKHVSIIIDDSSVNSKWSFKLINDPRVVIYDRNRLIVQTTVACSINLWQS